MTWSGSMDEVPAILLSDQSPAAILGPESRTWAEISLGSLQSNFHAIQQHVGPTVEVCSVVKADAYRHGLVECARALQAAGARWFGVTSAEEGVQLREAEIRGRILLFTGPWHGQEAEIDKYDLTPAVWETWHLEIVKRASARRNRPIQIHLKIDSGMGRLGVSLEDLGSVISGLRAQREIVLEGAFTHLASAECVGSQEVGAQLEKFHQAIHQMRLSGLRPRYVHAANSAAIISYPESRNNMVRPGISLYGSLLPFSGTPPTPPLTLLPVLSWKTRIISIRAMPQGSRVGYNGTYTLTRSSRIAVLSVGYGDGLNRKLSSRGRVIIRGEFATIVGRISMDLTLVDVTDLTQVQVGDEVILIGSCNDRMIGAADHAFQSDTIPYEIFCNISKRVRRIFNSTSA
jgi:alanine racemase